MAKVQDAHPDHRVEAGMIPEKLRARLTPAELAYRARKAHQIRDAASSASGDARSAMMTHARRMLRAMPLPEFLEQRKKLEALRDEASSERDPGNDFKAPKDAYTEALRSLKDGNVYPACLVEAAAERSSGRGNLAEFDGCNLDDLLGLEKPDEAFQAAADAEDAAWKTLTAGLTKGATRGQLVKRATLVKGVQAEVTKAVKARFNAADLDKAIATRQGQIDELRAEILKFKLGENEKATRAGAKPPFPEIAKEAHAPVYKAQATELRAKVRRLGEMSKDVSLDPDLRAYYHTKFEEAEKELTSFLRTNTEGK